MLCAVFSACAQSSSHTELTAASGGMEGCPVTGASVPDQAAAAGNRDWWPNQLDLRVLHQNSAAGNPLDSDFDYAEAFAALDLDAVKADIHATMTTSQEWWPADWGTYAGLFIRMAWHSAGTYRVTDGRGGSADGTQRFAPLNSWPDNANLDKSRRLLWSVKQKYGQSLSWADLMVLAGNVAFESAGLEMFGFAGGREDVWEPQMDIYWGPESEWLGDERYSGDRELESPLAAVQMGLIYVNPEGPNGKPDPLAAARDIRETFARMAMNDEETVALIAGGHTLGKAHGAASPAGVVGPEPEGASLEEQGFGWTSSYGKGKAEDTITSGLEGAWTKTPTDWSNGYFENLFEYDWELTKSPAGASQWTPVDAGNSVPDAHVSGKMVKPMMLTTDVALIKDPVYLEISRRFYEDPQAFNQAFARAWYKLTHRDMGPVSRLLGAEVAPRQLWQDPLPDVDHELVDAADVSALKQAVLDTGLSVPELVGAAWASAASYRDSDKRGGANGARVRLAPQLDWAANDPAQLAATLAQLEQVQADFNAAQAGGKRVSLADLIVLGGAAALEQAAAAAGHQIEVRFAPGRTDATAEMTDADSFAVLEPRTDGFRNFVAPDFGGRTEQALVNRAGQLALSAPEMTVLVGGLRVLGVNTGGAAHGVFTERPGQLSNDFFRHLLSMETEWHPAAQDGLYEGRDRATGELRWTGTAVDLVFGSNSQLRALAEFYAGADAEHKFVDDFIAAWVKVMRLDRFDLDASTRAGA